MRECEPRLTQQQSHAKDGVSLYGGSGGLGRRGGVAVVVAINKRRLEDIPSAKHWGIRKESA